MKSFPWQLLIDWYRQYGHHDFPWRQYDTSHTTGYRVWLAEILLQQTQADRVVPFYERILGRYPTIESLADASYDEFFPYYQGLGYYSRARNLLKTANIVTNDYEGIFPRDKQQLKKLPGVGEYTARAILAFAYGESLLAWDTNLETIFSRYYKGAKNIKLTDDEKSEIERDFQKFITADGSIGVNSAGFGERNCLSQIKNSTTIAKETSFSLPNSFGTFSTKSTEELILEQRDSYGMTKNKNTIRNINNALMDWARLMEPKNVSLLDKNTYIFTSSEFYMSDGANEIIEKKISVSFPTPDAQVVVILHQDHRVYYCSHHPVVSQHGIYILGVDSELQKPQNDKNSYSPFILPPSLDRDTRRYVQEYFRQHYALELSVRPVHRKWLSGDGKPYIAVNAQIQAGDASIFRAYGKSDMKTSIEKLYSL